MGRHLRGQWFKYHNTGEQARFSMGRLSGRSGSVGPSRHILSCGDSYQSHPRPTCASGPVVKDAWFVTASHPPLTTFLVLSRADSHGSSVGPINHVLPAIRGHRPPSHSRSQFPLFALPHIASDSRRKAVSRIKEAVTALESRGKVIEVADEGERLQALAQDYAKNPSSTLVISPANRERAQLNSLIHRELQRDGTVSRNDHQTTIYVARNDMTGAERSFANAYRPEDVTATTATAKSTK